MLASILARTPRCSIACAPAREMEVQRSGDDEEEEENWFLEDSRDYVTRIPVKRQKYIPVSKLALVNAALPGFSSSSEASNFLAICSCLEAILHAEHKVVLEELRVDRLAGAADEPLSSRDGGTNVNGHVSNKDINGTASSSSSRIARFQKNLLMLLRNAEFQELSVRDLQLAAALNSDYLLTLPINVDWKSASSANVIIFRRGYETEKQTGYLLGAKLDYAQSLVLRKLSSMLLLPLLQASRTFIQKNQAAENGNGTVAWTEAIKKWLEEPLPPDSKNDAELDLASSTVGDEGDLPIWLAARRAVPRYEAVLSGSRGKLLRRVLAWFRILPPEGTDISKLFKSGPPTREPHLRPNYLSRVSMRDIWQQLDSQKGAWKKLRTVWSILFTKSMLQEPAFKELVVIHENLAAGNEFDEPSQVELSAYTNIPVPDLKVVFPNKRLSYRLLDTVRLDLTTVLGLLAFLVNYRFDDILSSPSAFILDIIATGSLLVFATRAALGYKQTWDRYELLVKKTLYEKTLASDFGVVHFLVDASEEQQLKEAILLYGLMLQAKDQELALNAVAVTCERYMYSKFKKQIEMPGEDAVRILLRLGLVTRTVNVLRAKPHAEAVRMLESKWQALLTSQTIWMSSRYDDVT